MNTIIVDAPEFIKTIRLIQKLASDVAMLQFMLSGESKLKIQANGLPAFAFVEIPLIVEGLIEQPFAIRCPNSRLNHMIKAKGWKKPGAIQLNLSDNYLFVNHLDGQLQLEIPVVTDFELFDKDDPPVKKEVMTLDGSTFKTILEFISLAMVKPSDQRLPHTHPAVAISVYPKAKHFVAIASDSFRMHYVASRSFWSTFAQETSRLLSNEDLQQIFIDPDPLRNIMTFLDDSTVHFYKLSESSLHIEQDDKQFTLPALLAHKHNYALKFAQELPHMQVVGESLLKGLPSLENEWLVFVPTNSDETEFWTFSSNSAISGPHSLPGRWFASDNEEELWSGQVRFLRDAWRAFRKQGIKSVQIAYHSENRCLHIASSNEKFELGAYIAPRQITDIPQFLFHRMKERKNEMKEQKLAETYVTSPTKEAPRTSRKWKAIFRNVALKFNNDSPQSGWTVYVVNNPEVKAAGITPVDAYQKIVPKLGLFYVSERHEKWDGPGTLTIHWKRPNREFFLTRLSAEQYVFSHEEGGRIFFGGGATAKQAYKNALRNKRSIECTAYSLHEQVVYFLQATQNYEQNQISRTPKLEDGLLLEKLIHRLSGLHGYFKRELLGVTTWKDFDQTMLLIASTCLERDHWFRLYTAERNRVAEVRRAYDKIEDAAKAFGFTYNPVKGMEGS